MNLGPDDHAPLQVPGPAPTPAAPTAPPPAATPTGMLRLTLQGSFMSSGLTPNVRINGYAVPTRWGPQDLTVYAGRNHIDVDTQWMRTYGQAGMDVDVAPGQVAELFYAPPWHQFATGSIGPTKQKRKGAWVMWLLIALIVGLPALVVIAAITADS